MYISEVMTTVPEDARGPLETKVYETLVSNDIGFERVDNDSISTMEECTEVGEVLGTEICKTILACTRNKSEYYLIVMPGDKRFESKVVSHTVGSSRLSFASAEDMEELLGTTPGNASPLSVVSDTGGRVKCVIDKELADAEWIACNVGVNTTHVRIKTADLIEKYLPAAAHEAAVLEF
jgi:Ala-tRNA(Pro) deacylase